MNRIILIITIFLSAFLSCTKKETILIPDGFVLIPEIYIKQGEDTVRVGTFEIMDHVVTNAEYAAFVSSTSYPAPEHWTNGKIPTGFEDYPVIYVNRQDIYAYTQWLNKMDNRVYTLPTAQQFEVAARCGTTGRYYWGDDPSLINEVNINYDAEIDRQFDLWQQYLKPARWGMQNKVGLYGMAGNVWQYTLFFPDPAVRDYTFRLVEESDFDRVNMVGGSWARSKEYLLCGHASYRPGGIKSPDAGFRLIREPEGVRWKVVPRRITAVSTREGNVVISWAMLNTDDKEIAFNVYRIQSKNRDTDGVKLNATPIKDASFYLDNRHVVSGKRYQYRVISVDKEGNEGHPSEWVGVTVDSQHYSEVVTFKPVYFKSGFVPVFGDLEGRGQLGCVIRLGNGMTEMSQDPGCPVQLEAFTSYGRSLWRKDIASHSSVYGNANNAPFNVWDMDGNGRAEVITFMEIDGENYVSILDGITGKLLRKAPWTKMATDFTRSSTRHQLTIACLDGKTPAVITQTGLYENEKITAYDAQLNLLWEYDSFGVTNGSGGHKIEVADVDGDGKQEIFYGTNCLNNDGSLRWSIYRGHPDIISVQDHDPDRPGFEVLYLVESRMHAGIYLIDASTGEVIWKNNKDDDSRWSHAHYGWAADLWEGSEGKEFVSSRNGSNDPFFAVYSAKGEILQDSIRSDISPLEWDGDLTREVVWNNGHTIGKWNGKEIVEIAGAMPNPIPNSRYLFAADLCGDFRTEIIVVHQDKTGRDVLTVLTAVDTVNKRYIAPYQAFDYELWLARNFGGGYPSIFDAILIEPE